MSNTTTNEIIVKKEVKSAKQLDHDAREKALMEFVLTTNSYYIDAAAKTTAQISRIGYFRETIHNAAAYDRKINITLFDDDKTAYQTYRAAVLAAAESLSVWVNRCDTDTDTDIAKDAAFVACKPLFSLFDIKVNVEKLMTFAQFIYSAKTKDDAYITARKPILRNAKSTITAAAAALAAEGYDINLTPDFDLDRFIENFEHKDAESFKTFVGSYKLYNRVIKEVADHKKTTEYATRIDLTVNSIDKLMSYFSMEIDNIINAKTVAVTYTDYRAAVKADKAAVKAAAAEIK